MMFMWETFCWKLNPHLGEKIVLYAPKKLFHHVIKSKPVSCQFEFCLTPTTLNLPWVKQDRTDRKQANLRPISGFSWSLFLHFPMVHLWDVQAWPILFLGFCLIFLFRPFLEGQPTSIERNKHSFLFKGFPERQYIELRRGNKYYVTLSLISFLRRVPKVSLQMFEKSFLFWDLEVRLKCSIWFFSLVFLGHWDTPSYYIFF